MAVLHMWTDLWTRRPRTMIIVLHPDQADEVALLAAELEMTPDQVVRHLLSGPLIPQETLLDLLPLPA